MITRVQIVLFFILELLLQTALSNQASVRTQNVFDYIKSGHIFFQTGGFESLQGRAQNIKIEGLVGDHFTVSQGGDQNVLFGLGYFLNGFQNDRYNSLIGLNSFYLPHTQVKGYVVQEQLFTNLSYRYFISNLPILLSTKSYFKIFRNDDIVLDFGIGPNIMHINKFEEYAINALPDRAFSNRTQITFGATLGLGVTVNNFWKHIPVEIGYRFFYLGHGSLSKDNGQILNNLTTGNTYANALVVSMST